jgi:hypothetical protein
LQQTHLRCLHLRRSPQPRVDPFFQEEEVQLRSIRPTVLLSSGRRALTLLDNPAGRSSIRAMRQDNLWTLKRSRWVASEAEEKEGCREDS